MFAGIAGGVGNGITYGVNILVAFGVLLSCVTVVPIAYFIGKYRGRKGK